MQDERARESEFDIESEPGTEQEIIFDKEEGLESDVQIEGRTGFEGDQDNLESEFEIEGRVGFEAVGLAHMIATEYGTPADDKTYPVTFLEIGDLSAAPSSEPTPGPYLDGIQGHPEASLVTTETIFGVRTFSDMRIPISNKKNLFNRDSNLKNLPARVIRKEDGIFKKLFVGKVAGWSYGQEVEIRLKDSFKDAIFSEMGRFVTTEEYPLAIDVGSKIPIAIGLNTFFGPWVLIEHDEANRIYRYAAEGLGHNGIGWAGITTAYRGQVAFKQVTGTVVSGSSNSVRIESADRRPNDFYKFQWITIDNPDTKVHKH